MNAKTFLSLVVLIVASLASGVFGGRWYERQQQSFAPDESGSLARSGNTKVHALGRLEPHTRIIEVGATQGSRLDRLTVTEGDVVMRGSVLAHLDAHDERAAARDYAAAELAEA
ncbi:MAG: hypothetical protein O3A00_06465, partial [Planctomycetota bacterium]|nr:hypothetical protein [Planctomycetota bacterium]